MERPFRRFSCYADPVKTKGGEWRWQTGRNKKQILALLLGGILLGSAAGCGELKGQEPSGDAAGNATEETPDGRWLDYEKYQDRLLENRISIPEYRNHYGTEAEQVPEYGI